MPEIAGSFVRQKRTAKDVFEWDEYEVEDGEVMQEIARSHAERHDLPTSELGDSFHFFVEDSQEESRLHRYSVDGDGSIVSMYAVESEVDEIPEDDVTLEEFYDRERARHMKMTRDRLNALVGRANKVCELEGWLRELEEYDVMETVYYELFPGDLDELGGPMLDPEWLRRAVTVNHGYETAEEIPEELYERVGVADIDEEMYDSVVKVVAEGVRDEGYESSRSGLLDLEILSRQRSMRDAFSADRNVKREEYWAVWTDVGRILGERLDL